MDTPTAAKLTFHPVKEPVVAIVVQPLSHVEPVASDQEFLTPHGVTQAPGVTLRRHIPISKVPDVLGRGYSDGHEVGQHGGGEGFEVVGHAGI